MIPRLFVTGLMTIAAGCGTSEINEPNVETDPRFEAARAQFESATGRKTTTAIIVQPELEGNQIAICNSLDNVGMVIQVSGQHVAMMEQHDGLMLHVVAHELIHCEYAYRGHDPLPGNIMSALINTYYPRTLESITEELQNDWSY